MYGLLLSIIVTPTDTIRSGCAMLEMELDAVIRETIEGMKERAAEIGLKGNL